MLVVLHVRLLAGPHREGRLGDLLIDQRIGFAVGVGALGGERPDLDRGRADLLGGGDDAGPRLARIVVIANGLSSGQRSRAKFQQLRVSKT